MKDRDALSDKQGTPSPPSYQVYACGPFLVKRWDGTSYQAVPVGAWGGSHYPRLLLKVLLVSSGRQASRGRLLEILWPDIDPEESSRYLNDAAYRLRAVLRSAKGGESFLLTARDTSNYALAEQAVLWVDADAALALLGQAEETERQGGEMLSLLDEAGGYLSRGEFLAEEEYLCFYGRRATVARARRGCLLSQARAYGKRGWLRRGEALLSDLLEENALEEDALCALMLNLHQQGRTSEGLRLYEETKALLEREELSPTETTRITEQRLRGELPSVASGLVQPLYLPSQHYSGVSHFSDNVIQNLIGKGDHVSQSEYEQRSISLTSIDQTLDSELLNPTSMPLSIPSLFRTDVDVIARLSTVLSKPSVVSEREITYFDQQTRLYWRAREEIALPATKLYAYVIRHIDDISVLLVRSHLPMLRSYLCEIVCRTVLLAGILLYDMGQYTKARQQYQVAFQAATEANNLVLQAIVWGWASFTWTYAKCYSEALYCVQQARHFATQTSDIIIQAWLGAVEAEIQVHLQNSDACLQSLTAMERGFGESPSQDISYLFEFTPMLLLGYKGVCLQQLYRRQAPATHGLLQEAKESLEQALAGEAPTKRKLYYLSDLAGVYARQGEVETACSYVVQGLPLVMQVGSGSKTIRQHLLQVRALLQPYEHTSSVQALDKQIAPLLSGKRIDES